MTFGKCTFHFIRWYAEIDTFSSQQDLMQASRKDQLIFWQLWFHLLRPSHDVMTHNVTKTNQQIKCSIFIHRILAPLLIVQDIKVKLISETFQLSQVQCILNKVCYHKCYRLNNSVLMASATVNCWKTSILFFIVNAVPN